MIRKSHLSIAKLKRQILNSNVPEIRSVGIVNILDPRVAMEMKKYFTNANYRIGRLIHSEEGMDSSEFLLVFNIGRNFLINSIEKFIFHSVDFLKISENSVNTSPRILIHETYRINSKKKIELVSNLKTNLMNSLYNLQFFRKFKQTKYIGKRVSFNQHEIEILKNYNELTYIYLNEIQERQILFKDDKELTASFRWRNRGIINNMYNNLLLIEKNII